MKDTDLLSELTNSVFSVMENMFSVTIAKRKAPENIAFEISSNDQFKACCIRFSGSANGTVFLGISSGVLKTLTGKFTETPLEKITDDFLSSTLKEVLNIIAGNALTQLDKSSYIKLGIPEMARTSDVGQFSHMAVFDTQCGMIITGVDLES